MAIPDSPDIAIIEGRHPMRRVVKSLIVLALPFALPAVLAHASGGTVTATSAVELHPEGNGSYLVTAVCHATALPSEGSPTDVPLATAITCSITAKGVTLRTTSQLLPGPRSETVLQTVGTPPTLTICTKASATFVETGGGPLTYTATAAKKCVGIGP